MTRRPLLLGVIGVGVAAVIAAGAAYAYFFSGLRTAPAPLAAASPSTVPEATPAGGDVMGAWAVVKRSQVGYRVKEQFVGQTSPHEAVARTTSVSGGLTVQRTASGLQATALRFTVELAGLQSVDQVAGRQVGQRDRFVSMSLDVQRYPEAVFEAAPLSLPGSMGSGETVMLTVPGKLTVHGVTRDVTASVQARKSGDLVEAAGSTLVDMREFGVTPPQVAFTTSEPQVTIEFQLVLAQTGR